MKRDLFSLAEPDGLRDAALEKVYGSATEWAYWKEQCEKDPELLAALESLAYSVDWDSTGIVFEDQVKPMLKYLREVRPLPYKRRFWNK